REFCLPTLHPGGLEDITVPTLALAYFRLCPFPLGDVLDGAKDASRPGRFVCPQVALAVDDPQLAVRLLHAVLHVVARAAALRLRRGPPHDLPVFRMDELLD